MSSAFRLFGTKSGGATAEAAPIAAPWISLRVLASKHFVLALERTAQQRSRTHFLQVRDKICTDVFKAEPLLQPKKMTPDWVAQAQDGWL